MASLVSRVDSLARSCEGLGVDASVEFARLLARRIESAPNETPAGVVREFRLLVSELESRVAERSSSVADTIVRRVRSA